MKCESFPGPGVDHVYSFNPMMEFINNNRDYVDSAFEEFKRHHNKRYPNNTNENFDRKKNFHQNIRYIFIVNNIKVFFVSSTYITYIFVFRFIHSKNRANVGYNLAVNHLADYSERELSSMCGYRKQSVEFNGGTPFPYDKNDFKNLPTEIDWRIAGAVTPVKGSFSIIIS